MEQEFKIDCRHFKGDSPCKYYWQDRSICENCKNYDKVSEKILLIKLDAVGDVIRTTPLSRALKKKYPKSYFTWLVGEESYSLLENNPFIDRLLTYSLESSSLLELEDFDLLINLDKSLKSTSLTEKIKAKKKLGYGLNNGKIYPINKEAEYHYKMCLDNWGLKQKNIKTYQEMMFDIAGLPYNHEEYVISLPKGNVEFAKDIFKKYNITSKDILIGLVTGCGPKYPHKKWINESYAKLITKLTKELNAKVLLLGSTFEIADNYELMRKFSIETVHEIESRANSLVIDVTQNNSLVEFAYLINLCNVIITGDTAGMHLAIALQKPVVALFGPTPAQEIDLYGRGTKITPKMDCLCCYDQFPCNKKPNCMENISVDEVFEAVNKLIKE